MGNFVGDTTQGSSVNVKTVKFTPHGNGTHTECVGHISKQPFSVNKSLLNFHHFAQLVSVYPQRQENGDRIILKSQLEGELIENISALVIRTMPNDDLKLKTNYSDTNPPFLHHELVTHLVQHGISHLLIDLPSVDKEKDGGQLLAHKAFWQYDENNLSKVRTEATITEFVYIKTAIKDGLYLLNLQMASFELDASPSKPVLYQLLAVDES